MDHEHEPFLPPKDGNHEKTNDSTSRPTLLSQLKAYRTAILTHTLLILLYTTITLLTIRSALNSTTPRPPPALDHLDFAYTLTTFHNLTNSPYAGAPSPALDAAWGALLAPMHMRVSAEELRRDNQESVGLGEGRGYLGWLGVFHGLHCVNMLRKWHYKDYYHAGLSGQESEHLGSHVDHCIEMLRQSTLCHADASLTTFTWHPAKRRPMFNASESVHVCVDWERLMGSVGGRVVGEGEVLGLRNPLMGEGEGG